MTATIDHTEKTQRVPDGTGTAAPSEGPPGAPSRRVSYRSGPSPWRRRDVAICGLLVVLGVGAIIACWFGASDEVVWREQSGWLIGAIFGTGLVILGGGLWVLIGLRRVRHGFRDLRRDQRAAFGLTRVRSTAATTTTVAAADAGEPVADLVTAGQMTRAHRPDCLLLRGKSAVAVPPAELANYGRCGVCNS